MCVKNIRIAIAYWIGWLLCICLIFYYDTIDEYRNSEKVKTVVVDKFEGTTRGRLYYYPQFKFEYKDSSYLFSKDKGLFLSTWHIGDKATAIFPKGEPNKAEVYSLLPYWVSLSKLFFSFMISLFVFVIPIFFRWYAEFRSSERVR